MNSRTSSSEGIDLQLSDNAELSDSERSVLTALFSGIEEEHQIFTLQSTYYKYLEWYLCSPGVELSEQKAADVQVLISEFNKVVNLEDERELRRMSIDGRGTAIHLATQIYELCGLKITYNLLGQIEEITVPSGDIVYQLKSETDFGGLNISTLILALTLLSALLLLCRFIAKKNQLFDNKVVQDEFDEKKYA
jgi:hypothetical protein